jgi:hypothetical protein
MKLLLFLLLGHTLNSFADSFIVEMKRPLTSSEIKNAHGKGISIERFDLTPTPYFTRTYRVNNLDPANIRVIFPTENIEPIHRAQHFSLAPSEEPKFLRTDKLFHLQWGLFNQGQKIKRLLNNTKEFVINGVPGADIRWADAIKKIEDGLKYEPIVAVVDMGIDFDHPDIQGRIFKNSIECSEKGEVSDHDEDRDNNGLKGDCMGWNFAGRNMQEARRPYDDNGHGTHVAGIIAAQSNTEGISGVSSRIRILPIRVTGSIDESSDRKNIQPLTDRIAKGILYATNMGADVINLSLGWTRSMDTKYLNEALKYALSKNVIIVAAAGNNNNNANILPCAHFDVICVGAASIDGSLAEFSNYGGEVDILAPGDEIMSLIPTQIVPLQLNLQGYDIRSGTSQAAPFVSAAAALIRGNFPRLHRDEVNRRIIDSANSGIPGKSLAGMLNLQAAFELGNASSVRPVFKQFSLALYDGPTNKFMYPLFIKNFGAEGRDVQIRLTSKTDNFKLDQQFNIPLLRPGEVTNLRMEGEIVDPSLHNLVTFEVTVFSGGAGPKSFVHEFRLASDILKNKDLKTFPFQFNSVPLPLGSIRDGEVRNFINTVETISPSIGLPEYYLSRSIKDSQSLELKFFRPAGEVFVEQPQVVSLPDATQLLSVQKIDLNYDGELDYLIRAIACEKDCEDPAKASRYIQYSLWKSDLSPLLGEKSFWKFLPIMFNVDLKSQRFMRLNTKSFGPLAVPSFIETGVIPGDQQLRIPFTIPDATRARRFYYLDPVINPEGRVEMVTRTLSTQKFLTDIRTSFKVSQSEEVQAVHFLNQTSFELSQGIVRGLLSIGKGYLRKNFIVKFSADSYEFLTSDVTQNLWGFEHVNSYDIKTQDVADSFAGFASSSQLVMLQERESYNYTSRQSVEPALGVIASFKDTENYYTFFQTPSYLMLAHKDSTSTKFSKLKINRFSFLPGNLFNDTFYPVLTSIGGMLAPALYVDETDIQNNLISFTLVKNDKLISPIHYSSFIPPMCKALNPVRLNPEHGHSQTLLCLENKTWVVKILTPSY